MAERVPENVRLFLEAHIESVEQLEALLLLRDERARAWTAAEVSRRLRGSSEAMRFRLGSLATHGLLERSGETFTYVATESEERRVGEVARCFRVRRTAVIAAIFAAEAGIAEQST
ncbi:MAG: hypothetical protein ACRDNB_09245 [Gaiellaceae bacterium]